MKVISGIASAGSGSYGRSVWSRNRFGPYVRTRAVPVNPNSSFQQSVRSIMGNLAAYWVQTLAALDRSGWEVFASNVPVIDALGNQIFLTGLNWFIKCNTPRIQAGKTQINQPPEVYSLTPLSTVGLNATSPTTLSFTFVNTDPWANNVGAHLFLFISRPVNETINGFKGPYRFCGVINGAGSPPTSPFAATSPFTMPTGSKVFFRAVASFNDGRPSPDYRGSDLVA